MIKKAFLINLSGILFSRIFGFLRDAMQAAVLGASIYSDIFIIAFKFPNIFRRVFAEGAFTQTFLPFFLKSKKKGAWSVSIFSIFCMIIIIFSLCVMLFAPFVTKILALGYDEERIRLATPLVSINFWYLILIFITTYLSTLLQYKNIFWVSAYNTILLNLSMICAFVFYRDRELLDITYALSYCVLIGGLLQIFMHFYPLYKSGLVKMQIVGVKSLIFWRNETSLESKMQKSTPFESSPVFRDGVDSKNSTLSIKIHKAKENIKDLFNDIKDFFKAFLPAMLGASTAQIAALLDSSLVTILPNSNGGVSILNYANRVFQLPLALFAIALSSVLFPTIAKALKRGDNQNALINLKNSFWFLSITLSLATLGGIMLSSEIIWLIFERHNFLRSDTLEVALAFIGYMIGLVPFGLAKIFSLWLYSQRNQGRAAKISAISLIVGLISSLILMWHFRYFGLALAGSISGIVLLALNIHEFGVKNFLFIINSKKYLAILIILLILEFISLKIFKIFFSIS